MLLSNAGEPTSALNVPTPDANSLVKKDHNEKISAAISHAREVRGRLRNPVNAKPDLGINLKPKPPIAEVAPAIQTAPMPTQSHPDDVFGPIVEPPPATMGDIIYAITERL